MYVDCWWSEDSEEAVFLKETLEEYMSNDFFIRYALLQLLVKFHCIINQSYLWILKALPYVSSYQCMQKGIDFLNNQCGIVHGNICLKSVFADAALEWKLAGLEYSHAFTDSPPTKSAQSAKYGPPEVVKGGPQKAHKWWGGSDTIG